MSEGLSLYNHVLKRSKKEHIFTSIAKNLTKDAPLKTVCGRLWKPPPNAYDLPDCPECVGIMNGDSR